MNRRHRFPFGVVALDIPKRIQPPASTGSNAELKRLRDEDQADRQFTTPPSPEEWKPIAARDKARRARVRQLLDENKIATGDDYDAAALVFQHGDVPEDYQTAHELALIAGVLGKFGSMVALAEDRFLQSIKRRQRFGTQFAWDGKAGETPEEGTPTAMTEGLRMDLFVPPLFLVKRLGMQAGKESFDMLFARVEPRVDPKWQKEKAALPEAIRLKEVAGRDIPTAADREFALDLYRQDKLNTAEDYRNAARLVVTGSGPEYAILAHEMTVVAVLRRDTLARPFAAETWDRFLVAIGRSQRFGTVIRSVANGKPTPLIASGVTDAMRAKLEVPSLAELMRRAAEAGKPAKGN